MGEDKSLLPFGENTSLIQYQYQKLEKLFQKVYISSKNHKFDFDANILIDNSNEHSPLIALSSILESIKDEKVFIVTVDTPFIETSTIATLIDKCKNYQITVAQSNDGTHNLCGIFHRSVINIINKMIKENDHKIRNLLNKANAQTIYFDNEKQFLNINTPNIYNHSLNYYNQIK